ncbi:MAG: c-type cytochrome [Pirellulaceae bacterium]|nr:c-type cytochrome [Pirellulaceae bacterium]
MSHAMSRFPIFLFALWISTTSYAQSDALRATYDETVGKIEIFRGQQATPILTQHARTDFRPYLHPLVAPDGKGVLTQSSPDHHKHQTGIYWGFTRVNGRDYFHHYEGDYWRRVSARVLKNAAANPGDSVQWQTIYDLLDESGQPILRESQIWSMRLQDDRYLLDLEWSGDAKTDVTIGEYQYGGLFVRMPWHKGIDGAVTNSARQVNARAEGQRAVWVDIGMQVDGRDDRAHIAIFDHPDNRGFPQPWRVDGQMGVGPVRARMGDWKIPKGQSARIRHQLVVYTGELNDVDVGNQWSAFTGQAMAWAQWNLARQEGRDAEFLTPEKAVEQMKLQDGFQANVFASEPMITQPMAFCWDDRGRMWIAENRDYENRRDGFANFGDSRILILEDTDRDGVADSRKVFAEGIPFPSAMAVGMGGLWLGAPPNLLFVPDADDDDKADMENIEVRLTGWGIRDRHETLNSFHWGPDGWLYGLQGYATPSRVGKPAGKGRLYQHKDPFPSEFDFADDPIDINGGVWRYHPTKDRFEVVAHGFSNPWGVDYDAKGQLFITACVIPHLWHVIPGGIYHRQGGSHFNPYVYSDIRTIADHKHRSAHGGARIYLSDAFPEKYKKRIFMANIHEHAVLTDILQPKGSGFVGHHGDDFMLANNAQWIGFSVEIGPEGAVYVLDWHDGDICGNDTLNKETGRVFRLSPKQSGAKDFPDRYGDLRKLADARLVELQTNESAWHARRARTILQHRHVQGKLDAQATHLALNQLLHNNTNGDHRLRALWALHVTGGIHRSQLERLLSDSDQHIRAWAVQLICEDNAPSADALSLFGQMAASDPSPVVRLYLAAALQRIDHAAAMPILKSLATHAEDADDHNIPKMLWFALEPMVMERPDQVIDLALQSKIPLLTRHIARRFTDGGKPDVVVNGLQQALRTTVGNELAVESLLLGLRDALQGRYDVEAPKGWSDLAKGLQAQGGSHAQIALQLSQQFGDSNAAKTMLAELRNDQSDLESRRRALTGLTGQRHPEVPAILLNLLDNDDLRRAAIDAAANFDDKRVTGELLKRYQTFNADDKLATVLSLSARSGSGRAMTDAIKNGRIPRRDVPPYVARVLRRVVGNSFVDVWGPIETLPAEKAGLFAKYRQLIGTESPSPPDASHGRAVFKTRCGACHLLHGDGGKVGPDLTGANRGQLEYLLGNILTPSAEIQDAYRMYMVLTTSGRVYSGIPAGETDSQLTLRVAGQSEPVVIAQSDIEDVTAAAVSMMPDGLLQDLSDQEVRDLFAYLRTQQQVPLPQ